MAAPRGKQANANAMANAKSKANLRFLNIAGWGIVVLAVGMVVQSSFAAKPETPLCETRYPGGVLFSYSRQGKTALAPEELQARLGGKDRGFLKNMKIVRDDNVPHGYAMEIQLKRASPADEDDQVRSGIGFTWAPQKLVLAKSACLSYSLWLPPDFKFGDGGLLPGFVSDESWPIDTGRMQAIAMPPKPDNSDDDKMPMFSSRLQWRQDGKLTMTQVTNVGPGSVAVLDPERATLKPGQWFRIEEEVVLNSPGKTDGVLRAWVNGKLAVEHFGIGFRRDESQSFQAIVADIHHLRHGNWAAAPADTKIRISPFELRIK